RMPTTRAILLTSFSFRLVRHWTGPRRSSGGSSEGYFCLYACLLHLHPHARSQGPRSSRRLFHLSSDHRPMVRSHRGEQRGLAVGRQTFSGPPARLTRVEDRSVMRSIDCRHVWTREQWRRHQRAANRNYELPPWHRSPSISEEMQDSALVNAATQAAPGPASSVALGLFIQTS